MKSLELEHHGVKGMKWGSRKKYISKDPNMTSNYGKQKIAMLKEKYLPEDDVKKNDSESRDNNHSHSQLQKDVFVIFKQNPELYELFGGPDKIDDWDYFEKVLTEKNIKKITHSDLSDELKHYGVLGMKWGVRRYQKKNGQLTKKGRKTYKKYNKLRDDARNSISNEIAINAYNKTTRYMNDQGINAFNNSQRERYGSEYYKRRGYEDDYIDYFDSKLSDIYDSIPVSSIAENDKYYKKAKKYSEKHMMTEWSAIAVRDLDVEKFKY